MLKCNLTKNINYILYREFVREAFNSLNLKILGYCPGGSNFE